MTFTEFAFVRCPLSVCLFDLLPPLAVMQPRGQNGVGPVTVVVSPLISLMEDQVTAKVARDTVGRNADTTTLQR